MLYGNHTVEYKSETFHLHNANEAWWGMESNPVQSLWLYKESLWNQLCGDDASASACQLSHSPHLLLWSTLLWGGTTPWIQAFLTHPSMRFFSLFLAKLPIYTRWSMYSLDLGFYICSMSFYMCTQSVTPEAITNHNNNFSYRDLYCSNVVAVDLVD
jgi:hypothetical protein